MYYDTRYVIQMTTGTDVVDVQYITGYLTISLP